MPHKPKTKAAKGTVVAVPMANEPLAQVDSWIASQEERGLSRPEAIRRLVAIALAGVDPARAKRSATSSKSAQLAGDQLDRMSDRSATVAEQETRKHRLLKGPSEFREVRKDRNKR
jgi:hypothetical protein